MQPMGEEHTRLLACKTSNSKNTCAASDLLVPECRSENGTPAGPDSRRFDPPAALFLSWGTQLKVRRLFNELLALTVVNRLRPGSKIFILSAHGLKAPPNLQRLAFLNIDTLTS